jgi:hypothetical protein
VNDTDSVNGLLGCEDDYSVGSGIAEMFDDDVPVSGGRGSVTQSDLDYLSGEASSNWDEQPNRNAMLVDRMGEELLQANDIESEARILRKSLKLDARSIPSSFDLEDDETNMQEHLSTRQVSDRVHESTRALRSTMLTTSQRGSRAALLEMMQESDEEEKPKPLLAPTKLQILRLLSFTFLVMLIIYMLLKMGTYAVGPPRLPIGEYKIVEAQVGHQFFMYYDFYSGKDSAGSNGYNLYVSREVADKEGIVKVVTEVVGEDDMVEIYEDEKEMEVDWLLEDLEFLEDLKRKKVDEMREKEVDVKVETEKKKVNETGAGMKKSTAKSVNGKNGTRHLQSATRLEAFNPDLPVNGTLTNNITETFVYLSSSSSAEGPRNSIRLEGRRRFNRGLFIIDLRHMPAGE